MREGFNSGLLVGVVVMAMTEGIREDGWSWSYSLIVAMLVLFLLDEWRLGKRKRDG